MEKAPLLLELENNTERTDSYSNGRKLFTLSANDKPALENVMKNLGIYLEQRPEIFQNDLMDNVAYTLGERRSLLQWRVAIPASTSFELVEQLNSGKVTPTREIESPRIGFIFTGQGAQWAQMGKTLYDHFPVFAAAIDKCDEYLVTLGATFSLKGKFNILSMDHSLC
jgi:acyl transferase domain-containing protein